MSISLFPHNQKAYDSLLGMLKTNRRACIIHPTGTGKSFIGFKYCEDHPEQLVLWLSPSEYIFRTQLENLKAAANGWQPEKISFVTYAKLIQMCAEELGELKPDAIILDEFHRCGAEQWGKGVQKLLNAYPDVPIIGLTATNIRYLDNQRDMADELFDNCVASQMTLGEAIATGILAAPKYVLSVFSFEQDLKSYESRVRSVKNKAVRLKAEEYLEAIRRAVEQADGLDIIFKKHITNRRGKYILFVPSFEAMQSVKERCPDWFREIDSEPHLYSAYSDDPETSKAFAAFKDDDSEHMKVLLTINMLNEGIHVDDISGVILFRPTVSPIIYKQQIGRALSASGAKEPLILDVVANVYNLYTVDALRNEIAEVIQLYRERGDSDQIMAEDFTVFDEVADCRRLFAELDEVLASSWDEMYRRLVLFKAEYGHVNVHAHYKTPDGLSLGNWCACQRQVYAGKIRGILTEERIRKLNALGFQWNPTEERWLEHYHCAEEYQRKNGNLLVKNDYETDDGIRLGVWIHRNRNAFKNRKLPEEKIQMLQQIGMIWDVDEYRWDCSYELCRKYYELHGCPPPTTYIAEDGSTPGKWLSRVVIHHIDEDTRYTKLRDDQIERLKQIGVSFERQNDLSWNRAFAEAEEYYRIHHDLNVPSTYVTQDGVKLYSWLKYQRQTNAGLSKGVMTPEHKAKLDSLHFDWELQEKKEDTWPCYFESLKRYVDKHDGVLPSSNYVDENGLRVGHWLTNQRTKYRAGKLDREQETLLRGAGIDFKDYTEKLWSEGYHQAMKYFNEHHDMILPTAYRTEDGFALGEWVRTQIKLEKSGKLRKERKALLDRLSVQWKSSPVT